MIHYVTGFMFSENYQHVVLIEKITPLWQRGGINGVGGKIEDGESAREAMSREFAEETGLVTSPTVWRHYCRVTCQYEYQIDFFTCCHADAGNVRTMEKEVVLVCDPQTLPENIISNLRWLIPMAQDSALDPNHPVHVEERREERQSTGRNIPNHSYREGMNNQDLNNP